jgi:hypothetical protein
LRVNPERGDPERSQFERSLKTLHGVPTQIDQPTGLTVDGDDAGVRMRIEQPQLPYSPLPPNRTDLSPADAQFGTSGWAAATARAVDNLEREEDVVGQGIRVLDADRQRVAQ